LTILVLDASAAVEILFDTKIGRSIEAKLPVRRAFWAPEHYYVEVAGAIRRWEYSGATEPATARDALDQLLTAELWKVPIPHLLPKTWPRRGHLTIADALYVVLAEELRATLVTADLRLANSPRLVVPTITP
jgi:predicted nucleic acid-binding protein